MKVIPSLQQLKDNIVIHLNPFEITGVPDGWDGNNYRFIKNGKNIFGVDIVEWCSLPDILMDKKSRQFVGLSFLMVNDHRSDIQTLVSKTANNSCRYILNSDSIHKVRYEDFGSSDRLELYWGNHDAEVVCEFASLFEGCWLFEGSENSMSSNQMPYGFWLSLVESIKETYDLV